MTETNRSSLRPLVPNRRDAVVALIVNVLWLISEAIAKHL